MRIPNVTTSGPSRRPILLAVGLLFAFEVVSIGATLVFDRVSGLDGKARDLVVEALLAAGVAGLIAALGWWRSTAFSTGHSRNLRLLILPLALTVLPLLGGVRNVETSTIGLLVVGYALNSIAEDGMFRGIVPRVLRSRGLLVAVVLSSLLFGLAHFGNIVSRPDQSVAITAAQALGAFTQGIGLVVVRLVMDTIWPVMLVHFLGDLFGQLGGLPIVLSNVIESTAMLVFGIWVYRGHRTELEQSLLATDTDEAVARVTTRTHDRATGA